MIQHDDDSAGETGSGTSATLPPSPGVRRTGRSLTPFRACLLALLLASCTGQYDQREEQALTIGAGGNSVGSTVNPDGSVWVIGTVSIAGSVRNARVILRPILQDGSIDFDDNNALGVGVSFSTGVYQVSMRDRSYRGPILIEVRGQDVAGQITEGGNPATALNSQWHVMEADHYLYSVLPWFSGDAVSKVDVTPLTTFAVTRGLSHNGSMGGVLGGVSAGMFGLMCQETAEFFGLGRIRAITPNDFAKTGAIGGSNLYGYAMAALSQVAKDIGVTNVFDFYLGMARDGLDDGLLNGSIGIVPNTAIAMPDLSSAGLIGNALFNNFMDPLNLDRRVGIANTSLVPGSALDNLITQLDAARDINTVTRAYDYAVRVPGLIELAPGQTRRTSILTLESLGGTDYHPYGDSSGPGFTEFNWVSSSPGDVDVQPYGVVAANALATPGNYTLTLTVRPAIGQTLLTGPVSNHTVTVRVR